MIRRLGLLLVGGIAVVMLLGACGDDDDDSTPTATTEATTEATSEPTEAATEAPTEEATEEPTAEATEESTAEPMADTVSIGTTGLGDVLVGPDGLTLYMFTNDEPGVSNCTGGCLEAWPPLLVEDGEEPVAGDSVTGTLGTIERDDGTIQVTIDDQPLYYWAADAAPGDTGGQGVNDVWFAVRGDGTAVPVS